MSLLSDEGMLSYSDARELERATIAKTLKAVAEWRDGQCRHGLRRAHCLVCEDEMWVAIREGKMPREE